VLNSAPLRMADPNLVKLLNWNSSAEEHADRSEAWVSDHYKVEGSEALIYDQKELCLPSLRLPKSLQFSFNKISNYLISA